MATAQQLINRALTSIGVLAAGETATAEESSNALVSLNDLIQSWSNENLMIFEDVQISKAMTGAVSYTIGASGDINTTRPMSITSAFYRLNNEDYPVKVIQLEEYDAIPDKTSVGSIPDVVYFRTGYPLITMYPYPQVSSGTLYLETRKPVTEFATLSTSASFPVGYERAIRLCLGVELMPEYGIENQLLFSMAADAKAAIKRTNSRPVLLKTNIPVNAGKTGYYNILRG